MDKLIYFLLHEKLSRRKEMKYLIVFCLFVSVAQAKTVKARYETSLGFSSLCNLRDENVDYLDGVSELKKDAEAQCHSAAYRVSPIVIKTECKDLHIWDSKGFYATFTADFVCE